MNDLKDYRAAQAKRREVEATLIRAGYSGGVGDGSAVLALLDELNAVTKDGTPDAFLDREHYAAWFALCQWLRQSADYHERNLIRHLRDTERYRWADVAEVVEAKLNSRQAAQQRWSRLLKDNRGKPTGRAAKEPGAAGSMAD